MIPDWKVKMGRLTIYSTERFYEGWVDHLKYIQQKRELWHHYIWHASIGQICSQVSVLGFIFTWWSKDRTFKDTRPTQWDRLLG